MNNFETIEKIGSIRLFRIVQSLTSEIYQIKKPMGEVPTTTNLT